MCRFARITLLPLQTAHNNFIRFPLSFETPGTTHPKTQCHIPVHRNFHPKFTKKQNTEFIDVTTGGKQHQGQDSSVGIATRYGLEGPWIESQWEERFSAPVQTGTGAHPAPSKIGTRSFPGVKRLRRGVDHSSPSSAVLK
jgi:hypothetical protein